MIYLKNDYYYTLAMKPKILHDDANEIKYIYHFADIHIESTNRRTEEYKYIYEKVIENIISDDKQKKSLLLIIGDLLDFKYQSQPIGIENMMYFFQKFASMMPIVMVAGNHEICSDDPDVFDWLSLTKNIKTKYPIYYLKESGAYQYNNIIFYNISLFDKNINDSHSVKHDNKKFISLYHGFVYGENCNEKLDFLEFTKYIDISEFEHFDINLLGDVHTYCFLNDNTAYPSSLIQRSFKEPLNEHGYIMWNLEKNTGKFVEVNNDYHGFITEKFKDGKILKQVDELPDNINYRCDTDEKSMNAVNKRIKEIKKEHKIIGNPKINKITNTGLNIKVGGKTIKKIDVSDRVEIENLMKEYINTTYDLEDDKVKEILSIHKKQYSDIHNKKKDNEKIKFVSMEFSNLFSYGENNKIKFNEGKICCINGTNFVGKTSILDILCYMCFDRSIRNSNVKNCIMNINKNKYKSNLVFYVGEDKYKVVKYGSRTEKTIKHNIDLYKNDTIVKGLNIKSKIDYVKNILRFTFDQFIYMTMMIRDRQCELIDKTDKDRKDLILSLLDIDFFGELYTNIKTINDSLKSDITNEKRKYDDEYDKYKENNSKQEIDDTNIKKNDKLLKKIKQELDEIDKEEMIIRKKIKNVDDELDYDELKDDLKKKQNDYDNTLDEIEKNKLELENIKKEYTEIEIFDREIIIESLKKEFLKKEINDKKINAILIELIKKNVDTVVKQQKKETVKTRELYDLKEERNNIDNVIDKINENINTSKKNKDIVESNKKYEKKLKELKNRKSDLLNEKSDIEKDNYKYNLEKKDSCITKKELDILKNKIKDMEKEYDIRKIYQDVVNSNGLPAYIMKFICSNVEESMNNIMNEYSMSLRVNFEIQTKKFNSGNSITLIDVYKIIDGQKIAGETCSSFEKFILNLAFKISITNFIETPLRNIFFIDEAFSNADSVQIMNIRDLYDIMIKTYSSVFIISHDDRLKNTCDKFIEIKVEKNGLSKIV